MYKISLCVPIYRVEKYIERCAISLFEQTYPSIEYVFVDDCTDDKSVQILEKTIRNFPEKKEHIRIIHHEQNRGLAAARETAIMNAKGDYLWHVDSDDYIEKNAVSIIMDKYGEDDYDIINIAGIGHYKEYDEPIIHPSFESSEKMCEMFLAHETYLYVWCRIIKRKLYIENNIHMIEGVNMGEDAYIMPQLAFYAKKIVTCNEILYHYECQNVNAYTKSFSESKETQLQKYISINRKFVSDKTDLLKKSYMRGYTKYVLGGLKRSGFSMNAVFFDYYHKEWGTIESVYKKDIPLMRKILGSIPNMYLACLYLNLTHFFMKLIKFIKYNLKYKR